MAEPSRLHRRSFLAQVTGGAILAFAGAGSAAACTDRDPVDRPDQGRGCREAGNGCTDNDAGDPRGGGRSCQRPPPTTYSTPATDSDGSDPGSRQAPMARARARRPHDDDTEANSEKIP